MCNKNKYDFNGKIALVTGSSSGIGAAIALQLAQYGAKVTIHGRNEEALEAIGEQIKQETGHEPLKVIGDLLDSSVPVNLVNETIEKYGQLDFLINNAGGASPNDNLDNEQFMEAYDRLFGLNLRCMVQLTQLSMPHLEKTQGCIVNISSIASMRSLYPIYSTVKAAVNMFTQSSATHLGPKGVRVNAICPGPVKTQIGRSMGIEEPEAVKQFQEALKSMTILNRLPEPVEIANLVSFLVSEDAANITGSIVVSDTGLLVKNSIELN